MAVTITGNNTPTAGGVTYGDGTTYATTAAGTSGQVLQSNGASAPTWATAASSQWTTTGSNIYYNTGLVGIGAIPVNARKLTVSSAGQSDLSVVAGSSDYGQLLFGYVGADNKGIVAYNNSDNSMQFYTNNTERARFNSTGALVLAGGTTSANGIGITFPATQSASTNANTLDDYEEGTWTPSVTLNTGTATTYSNQSGTYTKTGRVVVLLGLVIPTNGTLGSAGGYIRMTGLPFTPSGTVGVGSGANGSNLNNGVSTTFAYTSSGPTIDATFESGVTNNNGYNFIVTFTV